MPADSNTGLFEPLDVCEKASCMNECLCKWVKPLGKCEKVLVRIHSHKHTQTHHHVQQFVRWTADTARRNLREHLGSSDPQSSGSHMA